MAVTAAQVKELRDKTGLGMSDCKKALEEAGGNMEEAIKVLRERGAVKAAKREGRKASEGLAAVVVADDHKRGVAALLSSETDFVARNDEFQGLAAEIAQVGLANGHDSLDAVSGQKLASGKTVAEAVEDIRARIGEKIELGRYESLNADVVAGYIHPPGKIGVLVGASAEALDSAKLNDVVEGLRDVAMHVAAFSPRFLDSSEVDQSTLDAEREIYTAQAKNEGKPEQIIPRIVDGKIKSFYKDNCLVDQPFAKDPNKTVSQVIDELSKATGAKLKLSGFRRVMVGEGAEGGEAEG